MRFEWHGWGDDESVADTSPGVRHIYTPVEAEKLFGIRAGTVRVWAARGRIEAYHVDDAGHSYYDRDDLIRRRDAHKKVQTRADPA